MSIAAEIDALLARGSVREIRSRLAQYKDATAQEKIELSQHIEKLRAAGKLSASDAIECLRGLQLGHQTVMLTPGIVNQRDAEATAQLAANPPIESQETLIRPQTIKDATAHTHEHVGDWKVANATIVDGSAREHSQPFLATLPARDKTQVLSDRLIQSLDEVDASHQGPVEPGAVIKKRFLLERVLGKGGMGVVFAVVDRRKQEARDPKPYVALKVLNKDFARHPQAFIALQREA